MEQIATVDVTKSACRANWIYRAFLVFFWVMTAASIPLLLWTHTTVAGWDLHVYANAIRSLQAGHDPYADGIAVQRAFHASADANKDGIMPPYTYVYSPITLPLLRAVAHLPLYSTGLAYWMLYAVGMFLMFWAIWQVVEPEERRVLLVITPAAAFFPALLQANVMFSGNLAYILYGVVLATAVLGWKRDSWIPFYIATLAASCFKAPLLSLVLIAVLSARKQWMPAALTALAGFGLFALQPVLWPTAFQNYLEAVSLQFSYNHDFGFSPSGLLGNMLFFLKVPYSVASFVLYGVYAGAVLAVLLLLSRRFLAGYISLRQWVPVMLIGVVLLNPRIKEYDVAPLALPMGVVAWRLFARKNSLGRPALEMFLFFVAINAIVTEGADVWKPLAGFLLVALFSVGAWQLFVDHPATVQLLRPETRQYETLDLAQSVRRSFLSGRAAWRRGLKEPGAPESLLFSESWYHHNFASGVDANLLPNSQLGQSEEEVPSKELGERMQVGATEVAPPR